MAWPDDIFDYVSRWLGQYPRPGESVEANLALQAREDEWLQCFAGRGSIAQEEASGLVKWWFRSDEGRMVRALAGVDDDHWPAAKVCLAEAMRVADGEGDLAPLMWMGNVHGGVQGWGPTMSSVLLAACRPARFAMVDERALATVQVLDGSLPSGHDFDFDHWEPYLAVCRQIAAECAGSLRDVYRALWAAGGNPRSPVILIP
jgi:hypothetical protein